MFLLTISDLLSVSGGWNLTVEVLFEETTITRRTRESYKGGGEDERGVMILS